MNTAAQCFWISNRHLVGVACSEMTGLRPKTAWRLQGRAELTFVQLPLNFRFRQSQASEVARYVIELKSGID